jgi:hypothetical protein
MNKGLKGLLVALVAVGSAVASDSNNKTHLNTRICRDGVPAFTTFHEMKADKNTDRLGGNLEVTGFFGRSVNDEHLAKSFGANGTDSIFVQGDTNPNLIGTNHPKVNSHLLLHFTGGAATNSLAGQLKFAPKQTVYGVRLDYFHRLDKWFDGLFLWANVPFVHVENDLNLTVENDATEDSVKLIDLFTGKNIPRTDDPQNDNNHSALTNAKMCSNARCGFGDVEAQIGWRFMEGSKYHASINAAVVFPTAEKPKGEYLWAARTGECKWGIGAGTDASAVLWEDEDQNFKVLGCLQYKYLFDGDEMRTLGLKTLKFVNPSQADELQDPILSPYYLVGRKANKGLQPLANVSTMDVKVKPGSQIDGTFSFIYNNGGFTLDVGYNLFWKEAERVSLKTTCTGWQENTFGVASRTYNAASDNFAAGNTLVGTAAGFLMNSDLDTDKAATPAQLVHKLFAGVGYVAKSWEYPVMVGAGVGYEFPSSNRDAAEGYSIWAKAGVAF